MKGVKWRGVALAAGLLLSAHSAWSATTEGPRLEHRSVAFPPGSASLSPKMQSAVQSLASEIGDAPVTVVGRDDEGSSAAELAEARAKIISAALRAAGLARSNMVMQNAAGASGSSAPMSQIVWVAQAPSAKVDSPSSAPAAPAPVIDTTVAARTVQSVDLMPVSPSAGSMGHSVPGVTQWEVKTSDITLLRTFERWSVAAGYKLKWDAAKNFLIGAPDIYTGSFEMALQTVLSSAGIRLSDYPLEACIYANTPPLVRITRQGEQARECGAVDPVAP